MTDTDYIKQHEQRMKEREMAIADAISGLTPEQWKAINIAFQALYDFDMEYYDGYEIYSASVPKNLKNALNELKYEFNMDWPHEND